MGKPTRPVLRYHGGKWRIAPWVISHFPAHEVYVEPFAGAASVFLQKQQTRIEVLNDLDEQIVNLFQILRCESTAGKLRRAIELTPFSRAEHARCWKVGGGKIEEARKLLVRSFQSLGAKDALSKNGWRTRTAKSKWSPCVAWNGWPTAVAEITDRLKDAVLECASYEKMLSLYDDERSLFYVDPPYLRGLRSQNRVNYVHELSDDGHRDLCSRLRTLKGHVVLSAYRNAMYDELLPDWCVVTTSARKQRNVPAVEALYIKPETWESTRFFGVSG